MPRLAIDKDFLDDYSKLEKSVQNAVKDAIDKFSEHTHAGLHLEKLHKAQDVRIRTMARGSRSPAARRFGGLA